MVSDVNESVVLPPTFAAMVLERTGDELLLRKAKEFLGDFPVGKFEGCSSAESPT